MKIQLELTEEQAEYLRTALNMKVEKSGLEVMKEKYESREYICLFRQKNICIWNICYYPQNISWFNSFEYKLVHKKHEAILDAYLKDNNVEIECSFADSWILVDRDFIDSYCENNEYRLKPKEEYPIFKAHNDGEIWKYINKDTSICMLSNNEQLINSKVDKSFTGKRWAFNNPNWIDVPYNKEREFYHKQPCWYKIGEEMCIGFYDIDVDMLFNNSGHLGTLGIIEPITPEQLKVMPFIWDMYKQLED